MPRLTNRDYLAHYAFIKTAYQECRQLFTVITIDQQRAIFDYFPPLKDWTEAQLIQHRTEISKKQPFLAAKAGRAFAYIQTCLAVATQEAEGDHFKFNEILGILSKQPSMRYEEVRLAVVVRPEIDYRKMARALLDEIAIGDNHK